MLNSEKTDTVRRRSDRVRPPDPIDRRILSALTDDAERSYAELGMLVGLSAPAVHERVKRLKAQGILLGTVARVTPAATGKPLLTFVHVNTAGCVKSPGLFAIADFPEVEEIHSVAGDTCMLIKVRTESSAALQGLLERIYRVPGVASTKSYVVLATYLERPVQGAVTADLASPV